VSAPRADAIVLALALSLPTAARALEPRFDHRDTHGPLAGGLVAYDTVARSGQPSVSSWRPAAWLAWGFDVSGEGDELIAGAALTLRSFDDPDRERVLLGVDVRYRGYFGADELKTFFELGAWVPVRSRLAGGPLVGLGVAYDFSRVAGLYAGASFATAFGEARIASFAAGVGAQLRFEIP
jgi:hypothetical protein